MCRNSDDVHLMLSPSLANCQENFVIIVPPPCPHYHLQAVLEGRQLGYEMPVVEMPISPSVLPIHMQPHMEVH